MSLVWLDTEGFNHLDVRKVGPYRYAEDPSFEMLMCAYAVDDEPVRVAVGAMEIYEQVEPLLQLPDATFVAHNATFDRVAFSAHLGMPVGEYLDPARWLDPSVLASCAGYPASLEKLTKALKVTQKDSAGTLLINKFCKPNRTGGRNGPDTHPEDWARFVAYCANDVESMREAARKLPDQLPQERAIWIADQIINDRGVRVDIPMARAAVAACVENKAEARAEVIRLTGVENPGSVPQMLAWFSSQGIELGDLLADTVREQLTFREGLPRRVLELRQELALASAPAKFKAAVVMSNSDGRMRGVARYHGAHTGRWAGRGIQLQNLPRKSLGWREGLAMLDLMSGFGASPEDLKGLVRPLVLGPLTVVDYSQIEARVLAWLAGEKWVLEAFAGGRDIYVETARRMGSQLTRQHGKVATLALGFAGGVGALRKMGGDSLGDDEYLQELVNLWRKANPRIRMFWRALWETFQSGGKCGRLSVDASVRGIRKVRLPSGREITYRGVRSIRNAEGKRKLVFTHPTGKLTYLWVGIVVENAVQAIARDLMAGCLPVLNDMGIPVVAHVHDEIIAEGDHLEEMTKVMLDAPSWAAGLPVDADGHVVARYTK